MRDEAECKYVHEYLDARRGGGSCSENPGRRSSWRNDDKKKRKLGKVALLRLAVSRG